MNVVRVSDETHKQLVQMTGGPMDEHGEHVSLSAINWVLDKEEG